MARIVLLDSGPLGMVTHPRLNRDVADWFARLRRTGVAIRVPEIADYEVRRELIRSGRTTGISRLDALGRELGLIPVSRDVWLVAAERWAGARRIGRPTAEPAALDGDMILAASSRQMSASGDQPVIATTNVDHLALFVDARFWRDIE
jgi:hypothetical protein